MTRAATGRARPNKTAAESATLGRTSRRASAAWPTRTGPPRPAAQHNRRGESGASRAPLPRNDHEDYEYPSETIRLGLQDS